MTTVSCHRATPTHQLTKACLGADLIVSAAGVPGLVNKYLIKPGSILIDVGLNRIRTAAGKNKVVGDMSKDVNEVAGVVTPVPGGVGPCTVACLTVSGQITEFLVLYRMYTVQYIRISRYVNI